MRAAAGSSVDCRLSPEHPFPRRRFRRDDQERQPIDVNRIALEVLQSSRGELAEHRVITRAELASELPLILVTRDNCNRSFLIWSRTQLRTMDNTTDRDRVLQVRTALHNRDAIIVAVEDSGPGLDSKQLRSIFDAFSRQNRIA
jgi:K+-sensing histidine kinase KdpD